MQYRVLVCALLTAVMAFARPGADPRPQMTWQGEVDGTALLFVHGKRLKTEYKDGAPITRQRSRIEVPVPDTRQDVRLQVIEGRGFVRIVEQPRAENDFTLAVSIEDRQPGSGFYSLALYWTSDSIEKRDDRSRMGQIRWSGRVDDEVVVSCAASACTSAAVSGSPVMHEKAKLSAPLPQAEVPVELETVEARGAVTVVEQPSERNGYTVRVRIRDKDPGSSDYAFNLKWRRPDAAMTTEPAAARRGVLWSARVAGTVRVTVMGGAAFSQSITGQPVSLERTLFDRPLPASNVKPVIAKRQGQGAVNIVAYPNKENGYELVFEIRAADTPELYEIEVAW